MKDVLDLYRPIAEAVSLLLSPHAEVVLHDLKTQCIHAIFGNLSKRKEGDPSLIEEQIPNSQDLLAPYLKDNWDGRKMKSVSAVLRNQEGTPIGLLCINLDISKWEQMQQFISEFIQTKVEKPDFLFKNDWREKINTYVSAYLNENRLRLENLNRTETRKLLLNLRKEGAFKTKNAAIYIADVLQISRASVYKYLKEGAL